MDAIMDTAERHDLEDCAHAHGARWNGLGAGTIGHFGSLSFQSTKTLSTGEDCYIIAIDPEQFRFDRMHFPVAEQAWRDEAIWLDESVFRAGRLGVEDAVAALRKISDHRSELADRIDDL
jgi:hypothetical protein